MQTPSDIALLQRWQYQQDALAFRALTQRYGALVFGICNRVLQNAADAEEITQDCFLKLAQDPGKVDRSVGPWLHSVAVNAAISRIRSEQRRRSREVAHESARAQSTEYSARDLFEHVDEAISQLPDAQRHCIVGYFLEGKPRHDVAAALGVSTKTVQRKTDEAIEKIREILGQRGITTSAGALATTMAGLKVDALPPALGVALGKIAVAGHAGAAARAVAGKTSTGGAIIMKKATFTAVGIAIATGTWFWFAADQQPDTSATNIPAAAPAFAEVLPDVAPNTAPPEEAETRAIVTAIELPSPRMAIDEIQAIANPEHYAEVAGTVVDDIGQPIPNAAIALVVAGVPQDSIAQLHVPGLPDMYPDNPADRLGRWLKKAALDKAYELSEHLHEAITDEAGSFRISGVRFTGTTLIAVKAEGFTMLQQQIELDERSVAEVKFVLIPNRSIEGRIVTGSGEPVSDARLTCISFTTKYHAPVLELSGAPFVLPTPSVTGSGKSPRNGSITGPASSGIAAPFHTHTDAKGHFSLPPAMPATSVGLYVESPTKGTQVFHDVPVGGDEIVTLTWTAELAGLDGQILLENARPAAHYFVFVAGTIGDDGPADAVPTTPTPVEGSRFYVQTNAEGQFQLDALPSHERYAVSVYDAEGRKRGESALPPLASDSRTSWSYQLPPALVITGRVIGVPSGKAVAEAYVTAKSATEEEVNLIDAARTTTSLDGTFKLYLIGDERSFDVVASTHRALDSLWDLAHVQQVDVQGDDTTEVTLELPDPWLRNFRVVEPNGSPVVGAAVRLRQWNENGLAYIDNLPDAATDGGGRFTSPPLTTYVSTEFTFIKAGYVRGTSAERTSTAGEQGAEELVVLYPTASATARLLGGDGLPLASAVVLCVAHYGADQPVARRIVSDEEGWISLEDWLPVEIEALEFCLPYEGPDGTPGISFTTEDTAAKERGDSIVVEASLARDNGSPHASLSEIDLEAGALRDLGDIVLSSDEKAPLITAS